LRASRRAPSRWRAFSRPMASATARLSSMTGGRLLDLQRGRRLESCGSPANLFRPPAQARKAPLRLPACSAYGPTALARNARVAASAQALGDLGAVIPQRAILLVVAAPARRRHRRAGRRGAVYAAASAAKQTARFDRPPAGDSDGATRPRRIASRPENRREDQGLPPPLAGH
jgi:hypothetical protein